MKLTKAQEKLMNAMQNGDPTAMPPIKANKPVALIRDCRGTLGIPFVASIKTIECVLKLGLIKMAYINRTTKNGKKYSDPIIYLADQEMPKDYYGSPVAQNPHA